MLFQTLSVQYSLYNWARDHRLHHRYTDTEADPHNSNRGFFFSHIGWSVVLPHPEVEKQLKNVDMSDIQQDKVAMFQYKYVFLVARSYRVQLIFMFSMAQVLSSAVYYVGVYLTYVDTVVLLGREFVDFSSRRCSTETCDYLARHVLHQ